MDAPYWFVIRMPDIIFRIVEVNPPGVPSHPSHCRVLTVLCMIELRTPAQIEAMRPAGRFVAEVLVALRDAADVGVNLLDLDRLAHEMIKERGAESCYIDYHPSFGASPFGKVLCTSVNDAVLHGLPHDYALQDGDLLSLDFACSVDGWVSDSALSVVVGTPREQDLALIDVATRALDGRDRPGAGRQPALRHLGTRSATSRARPGWA